MTKSKPKIWTFFYGTIIDPAVMKDFGVSVTDVSPAMLSGFDLVIRPRPNLIPSDRAVVFGSLMAVTHDDLTTIYSALEKNFGIKYAPQAVLATTRGGFALAALCYIAPQMPDSAPDPAFVKQLARSVRSIGHPEWYAAHVESLGVALNDEER